MRMIKETREFVEDDLDKVVAITIFLAILLIYIYLVQLQWVNSICNRYN